MPYTPPSTRPSTFAGSRAAAAVQAQTHITRSQSLSDIPSSSHDADLAWSSERTQLPRLRKKSGEPIKPALRPSSHRRSSSLPSLTKAVHFDGDIEEVRYFFQVDRPLVVSAGPSPVEAYESDSEFGPEYEDIYGSTKAELQIRLPNFPTETLERIAMPVRVERIFLSSDQESLMGTVAVANIAFQKSVVIRYTLDNWDTTSEIDAEYASNGWHDRFNFDIKLSNHVGLEMKTLWLCVRYKVAGNEYWDNNDSMNFQVDFIKGMKPKNASDGTQDSAPVATPSSSDEFGLNRGHGSAEPSLTESPDEETPLEIKAQKGSSSPSNFLCRTSHGYGYGEFATATLFAKTNNFSRRNYSVASKPDAPAAIATGHGPHEMLLQKPDMDSVEYSQLIQEYCFFGSSESVPILV